MKLGVYTRQGKAAADERVGVVVDGTRIGDVRAAYAAALKDVVASSRDAVGVAIAVNGTVEEVDIYPGPALLAKVYPALIQSYALAAATEPRPAGASRHPDVTAVAASGIGSKTVSWPWESGPTPESTTSTGCPAGSSRRRTLPSTLRRAHPVA